MFNEKSDKTSSDLINLEYDQAVQQYGRNYKDYEEAKKVLEEELEESWSELNMLRASVTEWTNSNIEGRATDIYRYSRAAIKELAQVAAVARKIINGYGDQEAAK